MGVLPCKRSLAEGGGHGCSGWNARRQHTDVPRRLSPHPPPVVVFRPAYALPRAFPLTRSRRSRLLLGRLKPEPGPNSSGTKKCDLLLGRCSQLDVWPELALSVRSNVTRRSPYSGLGKKNETARVPLGTRRKGANNRLWEQLVCRVGWDTVRFVVMCAG